MEVCGYAKFSTSLIGLAEAAEKGRMVTIGSVIVTGPNLVALATIAKLANLSYMESLMHVLDAPHTTTDIICRGGSRPCRGGLASRPYQTVSTNHAFIGAVPRRPLQIDL